MSSQKPDFTTDFEPDFNPFGPGKVLTPPTTEFNKGTQSPKIFHNDSFLQPEPIKKQKTLHRPQNQGTNKGQAITMKDGVPGKIHHESLHHQDSTAAVGASISDGKSKVETILRELGQDILKWTQPFQEGEAFEAMCVIKLDELLKVAHKLEQQLKNEKEHMRERLTFLTQTLAPT